MVLVLNHNSSWGLPASTLCGVVVVTEHSHGGWDKQCACFQTSLPLVMVVVSQHCRWWLETEVHTSVQVFLYDTFALYLSRTFALNHNERMCAHACVQQFQSTRLFSFDGMHWQPMTLGQFLIDKACIFINGYIWIAFLYVHFCNCSKHILFLKLKWFSQQFQRWLIWCERVWCVGVGVGGGAGGGGGQLHFGM